MDEGESQNAGGDSVAVGDDRTHEEQLHRARQINDCLERRNQRFAHALEQVERDIERLLDSLQLSGGQQSDVARPHQPSRKAERKAKRDREVELDL